MIDLYTWSTPNGRKVSIMLEELGLAYAFHPVDIAKGEQFKPGFLTISPNNKIPAIVDEDGPGGAPFSLMESGPTCPIWNISHCRVSRRGRWPVGRKRPVFSAR